MKIYNRKKLIFYTLLISLIFSSIWHHALPVYADYYIPDSEVLKETKLDSAILKLSYNDGIQCLINESLVINALEEYHASHYWDRKIDVYKYFKEGENLIACHVSNGDENRGTGGGNFDAELILNGEEIIKRGDTTEACARITNVMWRFYGEKGSTSYPPKDGDRDTWYQFGYNDDDWKYGVAPFGTGDNKPRCTSSVLIEAPDNAWFRKKFFLNAEQLGITPTVFPEFKQAFLGAYPTPTIISVAENRDINQNPKDVYYTKYPTPIFTGLTKYGSNVKIYIDDKFIDYAQVQHGEKSGTANFFYWYRNYLPEGKHTMYAITENPLSKFTSPPSAEVTFEVVTMPSPTILSLGENSKVDMTQVYITSYKTPLITGISPYGQELKIYIDNEYVGKAAVQEGEKTGISNFYIMPRLSPGRHTVVATAYDPQLDLESIARQVITFEVR